MLSIPFLSCRFQDAMGSTEFSSMDDLESYAEYSQSSLLYLLLEAMQVRSEPAEFAASHVGVCKGIVTLLRGHELHRSQVGRWCCRARRCGGHTCAVAIRQAVLKHVRPFV
jgi:hypothetical protein